MIDPILKRFHHLETKLPTGEVSENHTNYTQTLAASKETAWMSVAGAIAWDILLRGADLLHVGEV